MAKSLPAELVDMTIDLLSDDRQALCACALVAKSWTPRTRVWLFRAICIRVGHPMRKFFDDPCHPDLYLSSRFAQMSPERFAQYLRRATALVAYLRDLRLELDDPYFGDSPSTWDYILSKIPTPFPVRRLYINIQETDYVLHVLRTLRPRIASLELFSFLSCYTGTSSLTNILSIYPELRVIYPLPIAFDDPWTPAPPAQPLAPTSGGDRPSRLIIVTSLAILPWATRHSRSCDRLFLQDPNIEFDDRPEVVEAIDNPKTKSSISGMKLSLERTYPAGTVRFIESLPRIRVLQLAYDGHYDHIQSESPPPVVDLLGDLHDACAPLRTLVMEFKLDFQRISELRRLDWASLDSLLAQPRWAHVRVLASVRVGRVPAGSAYGCLRDVIAAGLPETSARGCLNIHYAESHSKTFPPPMDFSYLAADV